MRLEDSLVTPMPRKEKEKLSSKKSITEANEKRYSAGSIRKGRSESNFSTNSLEPKTTNFIKSFIRKVTPNPSPGNSDVEPEQAEQHVAVETPNSSGKRHKFTKSFRRRRHSPSVDTPTINVTNDDDANNEVKERSNTLPTIDSPSK